MISVRVNFACTFVFYCFAGTSCFLFCGVKVHIKSEKRKNVAITLSIKDLKGLLEVA